MVTFAAWCSTYQMWRSREQIGGMSVDDVRELRMLFLERKAEAEAADPDSVFETDIADLLLAERGLCLNYHDRVTARRAITAPKIRLYIPRNKSELVEDLDHRSGAASPG
jgi:hypothetical protein